MHPFKSNPAINLDLHPRRSRKWGNGVMAPHLWKTPLELSVRKNRTHQSSISVTWNIREDMTRIEINVTRIARILQGIARHVRNNKTNWKTFATCVKQVTQKMSLEISTKIREIVISISDSEYLL